MLFVVPGSRGSVPTSRSSYRHSSVRTSLCLRQPKVYAIVPPTGGQAAGIGAPPQNCSRSKKPCLGAPVSSLWIPGGQSTYCARIPYPLDLLRPRGETRSGTRPAVMGLQSPLRPYQPSAAGERPSVGPEWESRGRASLNSLPQGEGATWSALQLICSTLVSGNNCFALAICSGCGSLNIAVALLGQPTPCLCRSPPMLTRGA